MKSPFSGRISDAYSQHSQKYTPLLEPILAPMAEQIAELSRLSGEEHVLDLATGTGLIARALASFSAVIVGVDISLGVLRRAYSQSRGEIPFLSGDAHRQPFKEQCFDLVTCGLSLSHFSDVSAALREIRRVLRSGGRFITSAWGSGGESRTKEAAVEVRRRFLSDREVVFGGALNEDMWADEERGFEALRGAGFEAVRVRTLPLSGEYRNHAEALETALAWPLTRYRIAQLAPADRSRLRHETAAAVRQVDDLRWRSEIHYYQAARSG
ncbi:MAG: class I SAM-dependent methyltransferase [Anaerolineales bacterium]|jgi:SAM-dependent methyltransferase